MEREEAIGLVTGALPADSVIVSTTGKISRELYEYRDGIGQSHSSDFLTVGSMGHSSQIALGIAKGRPQTPVYCFDGDGAVLMHMGSLAVNGFSGCGNFRHIVFNNAAHDSVGGQPTLGGKIDMTAVASACGYKHIYAVSTRDELNGILKRFSSECGPAFLEIKVRRGARKELGRPKTSPVETKEQLMNFIKERTT